MSEENAVVDLSAENLERIYNELAPADYVRYVQEIDTEFLWLYLTEYVHCLNNQLLDTKKDLSKIESAIRMVQKGFRYYSEKNDALRYYFYGYFSHQQDEILQKMYINYNRDRLERLLSKKHLRELIEYLYEHDIVQQKDLANYLRISKTNIDRKVMPLIEYGLVEKIKTGFVFYKLTATGYEYCRQKRNEVQDPYIADSFSHEFATDDDFDMLPDFDKEDTKIALLSITNRRYNYQKEVSSNINYEETVYATSFSRSVSRKRAFFQT